MTDTDQVVVIGAGIGGLTVAALLARAGLAVTVLEAHVYPGGCAGTFYHQGYRFDAGATLAGGFYPGGPMDVVAEAAGIAAWPARPSEPSMAVHLPDSTMVARYGDDRRWEQRDDVFGIASREFWQWQERTADAMWKFALRTPPWPPQTLGEMSLMASDSLSWIGNDLYDTVPTRHMPSLLADLVRPVAARLHGMPERMRLFVDAQLLIAAQTTSAHTNALYGASALDLPRRGVVHLEGGMGAIPQTLAQAVQDNGGEVHYRQEVDRVVIEEGRPVAVETKRGESYVASRVIANLPPWNIARLLGDKAPRRLRKLPPRPLRGGGAFMAYVGVDDSVVPEDIPLHHQVILREPMGEGNTVFLSLSPVWDKDRAPQGKRALTISTHTHLDPWWHLFQADRNAYEDRKTDYVARVLAAADTVLPGIRDAADIVLPANPVTFQRFTRRDWGWVGGIPQTSLFNTWAPRLNKGLWMVGDTIFPGQSTAAVALGGLRVAAAVLAECAETAAGYSASIPGSVQA